MTLKISSLVLLVEGPRDVKGRAVTYRDARVRHQFCPARRYPSVATRCSISEVSYREIPMKVVVAHSRMGVEVAVVYSLLGLCYQAEVLEGLVPVC